MFASRLFAVRIAAAATAALALTSSAFRPVFAQQTAPSPSGSGDAAPSAPAKTTEGRAHFEPQSKVAAKGDFAAVAPDAPAVKTALDAKDLAGANKLIGKKGAFVGTVVKVFAARNNSTVVLDFAAEYRDALTAVVRPSSYAKLPNLDMLKGKKVLVTGTFTTYRDAPQIELTEASQIKVVAEGK